MAPIAYIAAGLQAQRGHLFGFVPLALSLGIGGYFALPAEPGLTFYGGLALAAVALAVLIPRLPEPMRPIFAVLALAALGAGIAGARAHLVAEPVLAYRYYGPIEGRIVNVDRSVSDAVRLTLDRVVLRDMDPARTPTRIRVSMHGQQGFITPEPGLTVILTGHLSPPSGPVEPGGFDFQRQAWFDGLGAVGYTRTPVLALYPARDGAAGLALHRLRMRISAAVQAAVPGEDGAFAAALMTGDRSGMSKATTEDLRRSNLSHLLAISGLHMGLLTGFVYASLRYMLALSPRVALRYPIRKWAAVAALLAGAFYLALSGGNVATERAFVMVAVMFVAVLFDRRAVTLRAVAMAAVIILIFRPEVLAEPGFQMSFAATTALVAVFGAMRNWRGWSPPRWMRPVMAVVISSAVAGLATAPVAAAHFNRIADYGLLANLLSVPLMGLIVMPGAVLAACLAPVGLGWVGLALMRPAIHWILGVAHRVSGLEGAVSYVTTPPAAVLPLLSLGMLWLILWRGRARWAGLAPAALALVIWAGVERPAVLISETGGLVGVLTTEGRALNKARGESFAALSWLENDGDGAAQDSAFARAAFAGAKGSLLFQAAGQPLVHLSGRGAAERVGAACQSASLVILSGELPAKAPCQVLDRKVLASLGAVALFPDENGLRLVSARQQAGDRLWNRAGARQ